MIAAKQMLIMTHHAHDTFPVNHIVKPGPSYHPSKIQTISVLRIIYTDLLFVVQYIGT